MKIRCSCGVKYEFELTPEMERRPVRFRCGSCGADASEFVDGLIRQELGQSATPSGAPVDIPTGAPAVVLAPIGVLLDSPPPPVTVGDQRPLAASHPSPISPAPPVPRAVARMVVRKAEAPPAEAAPEAATAGPDAPKPCLKHMGEPATEKCVMCGKPICPKCMELFGWVCSPLCKAKADSHGIKVPVFAGQRDVVEARQWRKVVRISTAVASIALVLMIANTWYSWSGSHPKPIFSVRFPDPSYSGQSLICGKDKDQIVFLHGDTLARHDMKHKKEIWSRHLLDRKKIAADVEKEIKSMQESNLRMGDMGMSHPPPIPSAEKLQRQMEREAEAELALHVRGQNVWVGTPEKMVRYDWDTGQPGKELTVPPNHGEIIPRDDELLLIDANPSRPVITHINLASCEMRTEDLTGGAAADLAQVGKTGGVRRPGAGKTDTAGLPSVPGQDMGKPLDPAKVAEQAQHLPLAAQIALPATLSATMSQERALTELDDPTLPKSKTGLEQASITMLPTKDGLVEFAVKLVESRIVEVSAMKPPPSKSILNGNLTAGQSLEAASEMLNEMQRSRGGEMVQEDQSRYQVTVRHLGTADTWTGEVIGRPSFFPLQTVNVLAANKMIRVLDKNYKQLWSSPLNYNVEGRVSLDEDTATYGRGPCVEHKGLLYVFDQGVLTCFDMTKGSVRWRLVSVGITGIFFDDKDMIYVNTTSASPDSIKYSRQIDVSKQVHPVVQKVDSTTGKVLWTESPGGLVNYVSGKFIFTVQMMRPSSFEDEEEGSPYGFVHTGLEGQPYLRIRRINPKNGHQLWEHFQERGPLDIGIEKNTIRLVFKKEVQVLKFLSF